MKLGRACIFLGLVAAVAMVIATTGCENDGDVSGAEMYLSP